MRRILLMWLPLSVVVSCAKEPKQTGVASGVAAPLPATTAAPSSLPVASTARLSEASFVGKSLAACMDWEGTQAAIDALKAKHASDDASAPLAQSCDSLGQPALTTCKRTLGTGDDALTLYERYYDGAHSDKYMADCVKSGGVWSRNNSAEADETRNNQELDKLQGKKP